MRVQNSKSVFKFPLINSFLKLNHVQKEKTIQKNT